MTRTPVSSSNLVSIGYDPDTSVLEVEYPGRSLKNGVFRDGAVWHYRGVSLDEFHSLIDSPTRSMLLQGIKGSCLQRKVATVDANACEHRIPEQELEKWR